MANDATLQLRDAKNHAEPVLTAQRVYQQAAMEVTVANGKLANSEASQNSSNAKVIMTSVAALPILASMETYCICYGVDSVQLFGLVHKYFN